MYYNHQVDDWEYSVTVSEGITCKTSRGSSSSLTEMSLKIEAIMWYNVILVKLLDKFTRITPYLTAQNKVSLIQSPGEEMSHKRTVSTDFQLHCPKFCGNFVQENFSSKKLDERAAFHAMWVISSIFYMNFTEANPHWIRECN